MAREFFGSATQPHARSSPPAPPVRHLAQERIAAQQPEITTMRQRLEIRKAGHDMTPGGFPALGETRGPATP